MEVSENLGKQVKYKKRYKKETVIAFNGWCWFGFVKDGGRKRIALWLFLAAWNATFNETVMWGGNKISPGHGRKV